MDGGCLLLMIATGGAMQDPKDLVFRRPRKPALQSSTIPWNAIWWFLCAAGVIATVVIFLMTVDRTADTAVDAEFSSNSSPSPIDHSGGSFAAPEFNDSGSEPTSATGDIENTNSATLVAGRYIFKCKSSAGVSRSSEPCAPNEETLEIMPIAVQANAPPVATYAQTSSQSPQPAATYIEHRKGRSDFQQSACEAAKANREEVRRQSGLARTYDLIEQLDNQVRRACKPD